MHKGKIKEIIQNSIFIYKKINILISFPYTQLLFSLSALSQRQPQELVFLKLAMSLRKFTPNPTVPLSAITLACSVISPIPPIIGFAPKVRRKPTTFSVHPMRPSWKNFRSAQSGKNGNGLNLTPNKYYVIWQ